jgi:hypothetical protein
MKFNILDFPYSQSQRAHYREWGDVGTIIQSYEQKAVHKWFISFYFFLMQFFGKYDLIRTRGKKDFRKSNGREEQQACRPVGHSSGAAQGLAHFA